jgi:hypothetical protein
LSPFDLLRSGSRRLGTLRGYALSLCSFWFGSRAFSALPFFTFAFDALSLRRESLSLCLLPRELIADCLFRRRGARSLEPLGVGDSSLFLSFGFRDTCLFRVLSGLSRFRFRSPDDRAPNRGPDTSSFSPARVDRLRDRRNRRWS